MSNPWRRRMIEDKKKMDYASLFLIIVLGFLLLRLLFWILS